MASYLHARTALHMLPRSAADAAIRAGFESAEEERERAEEEADA